MEYGAALYLSSNLQTTPYINDNGYAHMTVNNLTIKEGARIVFDIKGADNENGDRLNIGKLFIRKQNWLYGPQYLVPVIDIRSDAPLSDGDYLLGSIQNMAYGSASLLDVKVECPVMINGHIGTVFLNNSDKCYYLHVGGPIDASYQIINVQIKNTKITEKPSYYTLDGRKTSVTESKHLYIKKMPDGKNKKVKF